MAFNLLCLANYSNAYMEVYGYVLSLHPHRLCPYSLPSQLMRC